MKIKLWPLSLMLLTWQASAVSFRNDREGESYFAGVKTNRLIQEALREVDGATIVNTYRTTLNSFNDSNICSYGLNRLMKQSLVANRASFNDLPGAIHYLRSQNEIDDMVVKILLEANETVNTKLNLPKDLRLLRLPKDKKKVEESLKLIASFNSRFQQNSCFDDAYRSMVSEIEKADDSVGDRELEALLATAYNRKMIDASLYISLEQARVNELDNSFTTLKTYAQKLKTLRTNKPLRDPNEKSEFVTDSYNKKSNVSRRMRLMENYTDFQIMLMAEVVKKLRLRLESDRAEILIFRKDELQDKVVLEPLERFRMALKMLRKETAQLGLNHYFNGRVPDYMDLMTASYEVSYIPAVELKEIAGLEEIWNPKKTFWEKSQSWIRGIGSIGTIVLPPPFGFIPALGIVVIEMTTKKNTTNENDPTSLF